MVNGLNLYNLSPQYTKVGILGLGLIGFEFAELCYDLGFDVHYFSRTDKNQKRFTYHNSIFSLIKEVHVVSIHLASNKKTKNIINAELEEVLKGKIIINTSRGDLVDEYFLFEQLTSGNIIGAGLDVFQIEPFSGISKKIAQHNSVIATSHISCYDPFSIKNVGIRALKNINIFLIKIILN